MAYGLQVRDSNNDLILDITDKIGRYHGSVSTSGLSYLQTVNLSVPGYALDGTWFYYIGGDDWYYDIVPQAGSIKVTYRYRWGDLSQPITIYIFRC